MLTSLDKNKTINCPICDSNKRAIFTNTKKFNIAECKNCKLTYSYVKLTPAELDKIYKGYDRSVEISDISKENYRKKSKSFDTKIDTCRQKYYYYFSQIHAT